MKEFNGSGELIIQDGSINSPGSPVNKRYVDDAVVNAHRSPRVLLHYGTGDPVLSSFPDARVGDIIERVSDGSRWMVEE